MLEYDIYQIDEMNPFGIKRFHERVNYQKNTALPEQTVNIIQRNYVKPKIYRKTPQFVDVLYELEERTPHMGFKTYKWDISAGDILKGGKTFDKYILIRTSIAINTDIVVSVTITDQKMNAISSQIFTHLVAPVASPAEIVSMEETISGSCNVYPGYTCATESTYSATIANTVGEVILNWNVVGADFVDNGDGTITVSSDSSIDTNFTVELELIDDWTVATRSIQSKHTRIQTPVYFDQSVSYNNTNIATEFIA